MHLTRWCLPLFGIVLLITSACVPAYVVPPAHAPLFADEGEVSAAVQGSLRGVDVQAGAAVTGNVAVVVETSIDTSTVHTHYSGTAGGGYFIPFGIGRFEALGGVGGGIGSGTDFLSTIIRRGWFIRPWAQAAIGLGHDIVDFAFINRLAYVMFKWDPDATGRDPTSDAFYYEPTLMVRLGYRFIKAEAQFGLSFPFAQTAGRIPSSLNFNFGFGLRGTFDFWGEDEIHPPGGDWGNSSDEEEPPAEGTGEPPPPAGGPPPEGAASESSLGASPASAPVETTTVTEPPPDGPVPYVSDDPALDDLPLPPPTPAPAIEPLQPAPPPPAAEAESGVEQPAPEATDEAPAGGKKKGKGKGKKKAKGKKKGRSP